MTWVLTDGGLHERTLVVELANVGVRQRLLSRAAHRRVEIKAALQELGLWSGMARGKGRRQAQMRLSMSFE